MRTLLVILALGIISCTASKHRYREPDTSFMIRVGYVKPTKHKDTYIIRGMDTAGIVQGPRFWVRSLPNRTPVVGDCYPVLQSQIMEPKF